MLGLVKDRAGRNDPCPCGSGKKYKACHQPIDMGSERLERLLSGNPLPPAPIEHDLMGVTEHVACALRGEERIKRLGDRFDSSADTPETVEWALAAFAAASKGDRNRALSRAEHVGVE